MTHLIFYRRNLMASFNEVLLMGNLTRDPELKFTANGTALCKFGLAVNRKYKSGEEWKEDVCFVDITVWNKQAENCNQYLEKGRPIFLSGRLTLNQWKTDEGQNRSKLEVTANNIQFLGESQGGKPHDEGQGKKPAPDDIPF
jgi:single-strand DNA-binding protein